MTSSGTKPCAACGSAVADVALGRGAVEGSDGKRYCSPCAAKLKKGSAKGSVRIVTPRQAAPPAAPAKPEEEPITVLPLNQKPAAPAPAARKATTVRLAPGKKPSAAVKPDAKNGANPKASQRISHRGSVRATMPWHKRIGQRGLILIISGAVVLLVLFVVGISAAVKYRGREQPPQTVVHYDSRAQQLIAEGNRLYYNEHNREAALKKFREALEEAQRVKDEDTAVYINRIINGINKTTPVNVH